MVGSGGSGDWHWAYPGSLPFTGIRLYDRKGASVDVRVEDGNDRIYVNRDSGLDHVGYTVVVDNGATITLPDSSNIQINGSIYYVQETVSEGAGTQWVSRDATTSLTLGDLDDIEVGETVTADVTIAPESASTFKYFESSNPEIASVNAYTGVVTGVAEGEATITVYSGLKSQSKTITVTSATYPIDGIEVDPSTLHVKQYNGYKLSDIKLYAKRNNERAEELTLEPSMVTGTFNKDVLGDYTLTVAYDSFTTTFTVSVEALPDAYLPEERPGFDFGDDTGFDASFFFCTATTPIGQYVSINATTGTDALADIKNHISINGSKDMITRVNNIGGNRYHLYCDNGYTPLPGDVIVLEPGLKIYNYTGTVAAWDPQGDGEFLPVEEFKTEVKFLYTGVGDGRWAIYDESLIPTDFSLNTPSYSLSVSEEMQLTWALTPAGTFGTPKFTSSNEEIATVSSTGKVVGVAEGNVTITAKLSGKEHTLDLTVNPAKDIKGVIPTQIPTFHYSVLKDSDPSEFAPEITHYKLVFIDDTISSEFTCEASKVTVDTETLDTSVVGEIKLPISIEHTDGEEYPGEITVNVYEQYEQSISEVAVVEWFAFSTFLELPNTSTNIGNYNSSEKFHEIKIFDEKISYTRKDGSEVNLLNVWQLGNNLALFPEFLYDENGTPIATLENFNTEGFYEVGDKITVAEKTPVFLWTGELTGGNDHIIVEGTGETIIEGYIEKEVVYRFNGSIWSRYEEFDDVTAASDKVTIKIGQTVSAGFSRVPDTATEGVFTYTSDNPGVVAVNSSGMITGVKEGTANITATLTSEETLGKVKSHTIKVTVIDGVTSIKITNATSESPFKIKVGTDLDLSKLDAVKVYGSGKEEELDLTGATVTGFDKTKTGQQNVVIKITIDGAEFTAKAVIDVTSGGCGGSIIATSAIVSVLALAGVGLVFFRKRKEEK